MSREQLPVWPHHLNRAEKIDKEDRSADGLLGEFAKLSLSSQLNIEKEIVELKNGGMDTEELKEKARKLIFDTRKIEKIQIAGKSNGKLRKLPELPTEIDQNILEKYNPRHTSIEELLESKIPKVKISNWDAPLSQGHGKRGREPKYKNKSGNTVRGKEYAE